jgi:microcystin-dependent protein
VLLAVSVTVSFTLMILYSTKLTKSKGNIMEFIMGGIIMFGGNFTPKNFASCEGQLVAISANQALYSILGTTFGGDGRTTFALPDLRSRVPVGLGRGPGQSAITLGKYYGTESTQMTIAQMPTHSHKAAFKGNGGGTGSSLTATAKMFVAGKNADSPDPTSAYLANTTSGFSSTAVYNTTRGTATLAADAIDVSLSGSTGGITGGTVAVNPTGGGQKLTNIQPSLGMRYLICTQGSFPSRS